MDKSAEDMDKTVFSAFSCGSKNGNRVYCVLRAFLRAIISGEGIFTKVFPTQPRNFALLWLENSWTFFALLAMALTFGRIVQCAKRQSSDTSVTNAVLRYPI